MHMKNMNLMKRDHISLVLPTSGELLPNTTNRKSCRRVSTHLLFTS